MANTGITAPQPATPQLTAASGFAQNVSVREPNPEIPTGFEDHTSLLIIGSNDGGPKPPHWYVNLVASPTVWVRKQAHFYEAEASVLPSGERQVFWDNLTARMPMFAEYQENAGRELPVIRLTRIKS